MANTESQHAAAPAIPPAAASSRTQPSLKAEMIYEYALWYHGLGFNVVPLEKPEKNKTKKPTCNWKGWQTKRQDRRELAALHSRTTKDNEQHWAHGILGIDGVNDIRHLDIDKAKSYQVVEELLDALGLPHDFPWVVESGSGQGFHICFRCQGDVTQHLFPGQADSPNKAVYFGEAKNHEQFDHLELRWQAALTTLPPSTHWTGGRYSFVNNKPKELPPYVPLERLIAAFHQVATPKQKEDQAPPNATENVTSLEQFRAQRTSNEHRAEERWAQKALNEELWQLSKARNGSRNEQLNRSAFALGQIVGGGLLGETQVGNSLATIARQIGLADSEIAPTIASGLEAGKKLPRLPTSSSGTSSTISASPSASTPAGQPPQAIKPLIIANGRQEPEIVEEAMAALVAANAPPYLFVRTGRLVRIRTDETGRTNIEPLNESMLRWRLIECAEWAKYDAKGELKHACPTLQIVQNILSLDFWPFPALEAISEIPIIRPDGTVVTQPGYDAATRMIYAPSQDLHLGPLPENPTQQDVDQALKRIWGVIGEFPYVSKADQANALGPLLSPLLRSAIKKHVPMALVDAPKQGTGKGLYTDVVSVIITGRTACPVQEAKDDEEWRKTITSVLLRGTSLVVIDNVDHQLYSRHLSSILTLHTWSDRMLSRNEMVDIPHKATWIANGNNIKLGGDMGTRCYRIRMDAKDSNPSGRTNFTYKDLVEHVTRHRGEILADLLTIIRYWYVCGKPITLMPAMRTFSEWATMIGSILACAGVSGFLSNLKKMQQETDEREGQWYAFLKAWHDVIGEELISTAQLTAKMSGDWQTNANTRLVESLPEYLAMARLDKPASFGLRLGKALGKNIDNCFGDENLRLEKETDAHTKQPLWRVVCGESNTGPNPPQNLHPLAEPPHEDVAGDAGNSSTFCSDEILQEKTPLECNKERDRDQSPASPANPREDEHETASEAVSFPLEEPGPSAQSPAQSLAGEPAALSKEEVWDLVHERLLRAKRVMTPQGPGTMWRNWYGDVGVTLDQERCLVQFKDLADLLAIEPLPEDS